MPTKISEQIEALSRISKAIVSELYLEDILKLIVTVTAFALGSKVCSFMLFAEERAARVIEDTENTELIVKTKVIQEELEKRKNSLSTQRGFSRADEITEALILTEDLGKK
ncbi:MAG: hypothetical protein NC936_00120 [Candidatus Omnitrophica bacterium]|nr:hypothetical protein [Candidatus Omnitrophota bacterium]